LAAPTAVEIDVMPTARAHLGLLMVVLSSPSARLHHAVLGVESLAPLPTGEFSTVSFRVHERIGEKLAAAPREDVQVTILLLAPLRGSYVLDNVRFVAPCPVPVAGEPESLEAALASDCSVLWASGYEGGDAWAAAWGMTSPPSLPYQELIAGDGALSGLS